MHTSYTKNLEKFDINYNLYINHTQHYTVVADNKAGLDTDSEVLSRSATLSAKSAGKGGGSWLTKISQDATI